jgi:hypothetical protein
MYYCLVSRLSHILLVLQRLASFPLLMLVSSTNLGLHVVNVVHFWGMIMRAEQANFRTTFEIHNLYCMPRNWSLERNFQQWSPSSRWWQWKTCRRQWERGAKASAWPTVRVSSFIYEVILDGLDLCHGSQLREFVKMIYGVGILRDRYWIRS